MIQFRGVSISWRTSRTHLVVQSVCEAELVALHECFLLTAGIRELIDEMRVPVGQIVLLTDNLAAKSLSQEGSSWRTRHFAVKAERLRQQQLLGLAQVSHIAGSLQKADGLTKTLPKAALEKHHSQVGLVTLTV